MDINIGITVTITLLASSGFWAFLQWLLSTVKGRKNAEKKALLALLHDRLYTELSVLLANDTVSRSDYENINYLYAPYKELKGNGTCEKMYNDLQKKKIR